MSAEHSGRMMAQHVGCLRFVPATILLLFVPVFVGQLANVSASTTTNYGAVGHDSDDVLPRVVQSARVITADTVALSALPSGILSGDHHLLLVEFLDADFSCNFALRWSSSSRVCPVDSNSTLDAVWTSSTNNRVIYKFRTVPEIAEVTTIYLCLRNSSIGAKEKWNNIGDHVSIKFRSG